MVAYVKFTQYTRYHARLRRVVGDFGMPWLPGVNRARSSAKWKLVSLVFSYLIGRIGSVSHWSLYQSHWLYYYWFWLDRWNFGPGRWRCSHIWTARCIARRPATVIPVRCSQKPSWNRCGLLWVVSDIFAAALWRYVNPKICFEADWSKDVYPPHSFGTGAVHSTTPCQEWTAAWYPASGYSPQGFHFRAASRWPHITSLQEHSCSARSD